VPGSFRIARILGIDIRIHFSWVVIFLLVTYVLANQELPRSWSDTKQIVVAVITALLFFTSVVIHELAHSVVARRFRMTVSSITLFALGGVANLTKEPPSARAEFFMAAAGPLMSLAIAGVLALVQRAAPSFLEVQELRTTTPVLNYLVSINVAVALFNLVPGFPLDGGRVLRSVIWGLSGNRSVATRIAGRGGQLVAGILALLGANAVFLQGDSTGLWFFVLAYFLYGMASAAIGQDRVASAVGTVRVRQLMTTDFRSAPRGITIAQLIRDVVLPNNLQAIPVLADDRLVGLVTIADLRKVEQDQWATTPIEAVMTPISDATTVSPDDQLIAALDRFGGGDLPLLPVVDHGQLIGVLTRESVVGYVRMREMLGLEGRR
jgi:Zn-dependent protease/predicted transcriptional regulator